HFRFGDHIEYGERVRRRRRADQGIDVVLLHELLDVLHGTRRVAAVFERNVFDRNIADSFWQDLAGVFLRDTDRRRRTRRGDHQADPDLRESGGGKAQRGNDGNTGEHESSSVSKIRFYRPGWRRPKSVTRR